MIGSNTLIGISDPTFISERVSYGEVPSEKVIRSTYPEKADLLIDLIKCESGFDNNKCGDSGLSCGVLQYKQATFDYYCEGVRSNPYDQIRCAIKMIDAGIGETSAGWFNCWRTMNLWKYN